MTIGERQRVVQEMVRRLGAHRDQALEGDRRESLPRRHLHLRPKVAADQAGIGLADLDERFTRAVVRHADHVEALVGDAVAEDRKMDHGPSVRGGGAAR
jgi:hypothetical protein